MPWIRTWSENALEELKDDRSLAVAFAHPRDDDIVFRESDHKYFVRADQSWLQLKISVSGFYSYFFGTFNTEAASRSVLRKRKDKTSPYYYLLQLREKDDEAAELVREAWETLGARASAAGTRCHLAMELVANGEDPSPRTTDAPLVSAAIEWLETCRRDGWMPYRTEWSIFIDGARANRGEDREDLVHAHGEILAGQTDLLLRHVGSGAFWLVDYKFCGEKKLDPKGAFRNGRAPFERIPDNSYGHYLCQQSVYAHMLRRRYDVVVSRSSLLHVPTDTETPSVRVVDLCLLDEKTVEAAYRAYFPSARA